MPNSSKVKKAMNKAFQYIDNLTNEELEKEVENNSDDIDIDKSIIENFMLSIIKRKDKKNV